MTVEYLIVTNQDECFCNNDFSFNSLLQANSQIKIKKNKLTYDNEGIALEADYNLETDVISDKNQRYFHIKLSAVGDSELQIEAFYQLLRSIRKTVEKIGSNTTINTLWDDISLYYITKAYPLLNEIENLMRRLIIKFMVVNVGMHWINEATPLEVKTDINKKAELNKAKSVLEDTLHNADFIQLSSFLFKTYRTKDILTLDKILSTKKTEDTVTIGELKSDYYPLSNWDRHFSQLINYDGKKLEAKWSELYNLRNKVAHNKTFSKSELQKVVDLTSEVREKLIEAIDKLNKVTLAPSEKENILTAYTSHDTAHELLRLPVIFDVIEWYKTQLGATEAELYTGAERIVDFNCNIPYGNDKKKTGVVVETINEFLLISVKMTLVGIINKHNRLHFRLDASYDDIHVVIVFEHFIFASTDDDAVQNLKAMLVSAAPKFNFFMGHIENNQFIPL